MEWKEGKIGDKETGRLGRVDELFFDPVVAQDSILV